MKRADFTLPDFPTSLIPRIDKFGERLQAANPGASFTRTDYVTALLVRVLAEIEGEEVSEQRQGSERRRTQRGPDRRQVVRRNQDRAVQHVERQIQDLLRVAS
jgi:hypothetical protein